MSKEFVRKINTILCFNDHDYSKITDINDDSKWPYSLTMEDNFSCIPILPKNFLIQLIELKKEYDN